jgi:hypothetical protein
MGRLAAAVSVVAALAATAGAAQAAAPAPVPCHWIGDGKYDCDFYPAGDGLTAGAPVESSAGHRIGYLNHGTNYVYCEAKGAKVTSGPYSNVWWAYTLANDNKYGWVSAVYATGGDDDGGFGNVPPCGTAHGYPPGGAPPPPPPPAPTPTPPKPPPVPPGQVPCSATGGHYTCSWYVPGDGVSAGTPVLSSTAQIVGYLHKGRNWIICQQQGAERTSGSHHNDWYGWTLSDHGGYGWANALYASGGADDGRFAFAPNCNGAHGSPPSTTTPPAPPPTPKPTPPPTPPPTTPAPIPGSGKLSAVRKKIVSLALAQRNYAPRSGHCDRYGKNLICPGDIYKSEWCSVMATWVWEQAGVNIPIFGYSGDPWYWAGSGGDGITGGHARILGPHGKAQPGDMVFFGTPGNSLHVAVVLKRYSSGEILVMNGNDYAASAPYGIALESTFYPSTHGDVDGTGGPVYGYAEPEKHGHVAAADAAGPAVRARIEAYLSQPPAGNPVKGQDPRGPQKQHQLQERKHPAAQQMPYVGKRITIEVTNVTRSGTYVVEVLYRGSRAAAKRDFAAFLKRYHDPGRAYVVHYVKRH